MRRSRAVSPSFTARNEARPAPTWVMGPSRPAEPPEAMVSTEVSPLMTTARGRMTPPPWWKALMVASVPSVPLSTLSGMNRLTRNPVRSPTAVVNMGISQGRNSWSSVEWKISSPAGAGRV